MDNIIDSLKRNSTLVILAIVSVILFFAVFYEKDKNDKVEEFTGIPVTNISDVTGEEKHSIIVTTDPVDGKVSTLKSIPVILSPTASVVIDQPSRPLPVISPTTITNPNVLPKPISNEKEPCPVDPGMSDNPNYICDKIALSPEDKVKLQGYEDETKLYVPCGLNYDYPGIYKYRILQKFDFEAKNVEASKYDYGKYGRYNTDLQTIYDDNCRRY
jgi:hypothetical protein